MLGLFLHDSAGAIVATSAPASLHIYSLVFELYMLALGSLLLYGFWKRGTPKRELMPTIVAILTGIGLRYIWPLDSVWALLFSIYVYLVFNALAARQQRRAPMPASMQRYVAACMTAGAVLGMVVVAALTRMSFGTATAATMALAVATWFLGLYWLEWRNRHIEG